MSTLPVSPSLGIRLRFSDPLRKRLKFDGVSSRAEEMSEEAPPPPPAPVSPPPATPSGSSDRKVIAGVLGIILGCIGVHKFYLGYQKEGIIMLICGVVGCFVCGIPTVAMGAIGLVEGILYLTKTDADFERIYVQGRKPWF